VGGATIRGLSRSYGPADGKTCLAIMGSRGCLEIAVSGGSALRRLNVNTGDPVSILRNKSAKQVEQNP